MASDDFGTTGRDILSIPDKCMNLNLYAEKLISYSGGFSGEAQKSINTNALKEGHLRA